MISRFSRRPRSARIQTADERRPADMGQAIVRKVAAEQTPRRRASAIQKHEQWQLVAESAS
jgi:hypothetical protein